MAETTNMFIDEARQQAAQCWCDEETKDRVMDPALCEAVAKRINSWMCDAAQYLRNQQFCHGLIVKIGEKFGKPAYTSDDGSVQQDVLALKVPELVDLLFAELSRQSREAWMRGDLSTADRIAALIGQPLPSDHEKADLKAKCDCHLHHHQVCDICQGLT